jgi:hypothetical protein
MSYLDTYRKLLDARGGSILGSQKESLKQSILSGFYDSPSYYQVTINSSPTPSDVWIVDDSESKSLKRLTTKPDDALSTSLSVGDSVKWGNDYWLTLIVDDMGGIYRRGSIELCVSSIKWQDSTGSIKEAPFYITTTYNNSLGINQDNYLILGSERRYIAIQNNSDTSKIKKGQRFIFDGNRCWKVNSISNLNVGLINLTLEEDQVNEATDNVDLRVCDYITHNYAISITNGSSVSMNANSTLQLNITVTDNGNIVSSPSLTYTSSDTAISTVDSNGLVTAVTSGGATITVAMTSDTSIYATIGVNVVVVVTDNYSVSISGSSVIKQNQTSTYTSSVTNNGVVVNDQLVTFDIFADDKVSTTTLAKISSQDGKSCTVVNNNATNGYVQVRVMLQSDNSIIGWFRVQMKSLI